jgi:hypothetical protein
MLFIHIDSQSVESEIFTVLYNCDSTSQFT